MGMDMKTYGLWIGGQLREGRSELYVYYCFQSRPENVIDYYRMAVEDPATGEFFAS